MLTQIATMQFGVLPENITHVSSFHQTHSLSMSEIESMHELNIINFLYIFLRYAPNYIGGIGGGGDILSILTGIVNQVIQTVCQNSDLRLAMSSL